jgi:xylulokinase
MPLVLGVDSSAHVTKVELRDSESGELVGSGRAAHSPPERSWSQRHAVWRIEQDPRVWWQGLIDARRDAGGAFGVSAIAVAAESNGFVVLDREGRVLHDAKLADDTEATREAEQLVDALGGASEWAEMCGSVPSASFAIARLAWLRRHDPDAFARTALILAAHDWLTLRLGGSAVTDRGDASTTGYFSPGEHRWCPEAFDLIDRSKDWASCLPALRDAAEPAGEREKVTIAVGTATSMATALAIGLRPRDVAVSLDEGWICTVRDRPTGDATGAVCGFADVSDRFLPLIRTAKGTNTLDAFARALGVDAHRFEHLAQEGRSGAAGMQFFSAARSGTHSGTLTGVHDDMGPEMVARAVVEGVAHDVLDHLESLRAADIPVAGRITVLGGSRVHGVAHALADLAGRAITVSHGGGAATGACALAAAAIHRSDAVETVAAWNVERVREIEPNPRVDGEELRARYRAGLERFGGRA